MQLDTQTVSGTPKNQVRRRRFRAVGLLLILIGLCVLWLTQSQNREPSGEDGFRFVLRVSQEFAAAPPPILDRLPSNCRLRNWHEYG
jgi:hypothetical protein